MNEWMDGMDGAMVAAFFILLRFVAKGKEAMLQLLGCCVGIGSYYFVALARAV